MGTADMIRMRELLVRARQSLSWTDEMWESDVGRAIEIDAALVADIDAALVVGIDAALAA